MIGWLRGEVVARTAQGELLLDVGGVGYRVAVTPALLAAAGERGTPLELHVHTHVREDAIVLYGFATGEERRCFEALLGAHGVGPSLALAVMSALRPPDLVRAVLDEDLGALCTVPGIGRKTAARLVLDLRSRLELPEFSGDGVPGGEGRPSEARGDVRAALAELGYGADEIRQALESVPAGGGVEEMLRDALRELAGAR
ncbi:MAG TPA: Holliday junction branch migration protein RuvA [Acidimicrobiales bacterium]|nr:Holliday junction branch migration protein RuvA [Acidimicrobiales bacterium]